MGRRLLVSGFADTSSGWANFQPDDVEIWAMNEAHVYLAPHALKQTTLWFQLHPRDWKEARKKELGVETKIPPDTFARGEKHVEFLRGLTIPVLTHPTLSPWPDIPMSRPYPLAEVTRRYGFDGRPYLTSTPAYMLAYALYEDDLGKKVSEVRLAGIELRVGKEFWVERPCFEYYLGRMMERGIKIVGPPSGMSLLGAPVYGIDMPVTLSTETVKSVAVTAQRTADIPVVQTMEAVELAARTQAAGQEARLQQS